MEVQRFGDHLCRLRSLPVLTFLAPSFLPSRRPKTTTPHAACLRARPKPHARFLFAPTAYRKAGSRWGERSTSDARSSSQKSIDELLDGLLPPRPPKFNPDRGTSVSDIEEGLKAQKLRNADLRNRPAPQKGDYYKTMAFPGPPPSSSSSYDPSPPVSRAMEESRPRAKRTVLSRATVGRTIEVDNSKGLDFGKALRNLDILCATNSVKRDFQRQKFHERPGLKRKRLKSQRWRKLFREGFRATVLRVQELRRKGW